MQEVSSGEDQAGLVGHLKATGVYPKNIREQLNGFKMGVTHEMSQARGAQESGDVNTSGQMPG